MSAVLCPACNVVLVDGDTLGERTDLRACAQCLNPVMLQKTKEGSWEAALVRGMKDMRELAPSESVLADLFTYIVKDLDNLPVMPEVSQRLMAMINDPLVSVAEVADLISRDAPLTLRVMRVANSALYGGRQEIADITHACSRLGLKTVANIALTESNRMFYVSSAPHLVDLARRLWTHAIGTAYCSEKLGHLVPREQRFHSFLAGLMHDVGKVVLLDHIFSRYRGRTGRLKEDINLLLQVLASFHGVVGLLVAQHWNLPIDVRAAILFHNTPEQCTLSTWDDFVHTVSLANHVGWSLGYGINDKENTVQLTPSMEHLHLSVQTVSDIFASGRDDLAQLTDAMAF